MKKRLPRPSGRPALPLLVACLGGQPAHALDVLPDLDWIAPAQSAQPRAAAPLRPQDVEPLRARPDVFDPRLATARESELARAAAAGDLARVKALLAAGAHPNPGDAEGRRPLAAAAAAGHLEIVRLLLEHGASPNFKAADGFTPLGAAALRGHERVVRMLLAAGADPDAPSDHGSAPLHDAARHGRPGIDADARDRLGRTALFWALAWDRREAAALLLRHGARPAAAAPGPPPWRGGS